MKIHLGLVGGTCLSLRSVSNKDIKLRQAKNIYRALGSEKLRFLFPVVVDYCLVPFARCSWV